MKPVLPFVLFVCALACAPAVSAQQGAKSGDYKVGERVGAPTAKSVDGFREITWDDLIPPDWMPEKLVDELFGNTDPGKIDDVDPRAAEIMQKVREAWDNAPVVVKMSGQRVRIPGFVVPLEADDKNIREFLLVPYFGACIHVPPPPANQLILVKPDKPVSAAWNMVPVWVSGVLEIERKASDLGTYGYRMRAMRVVEYD